MSSSDMQKLLASSYLSGGNAGYLEQLYEQFLSDPASVDQKWREYFQSLPKVNGLQTFDISHAAIQQQFLDLAKSSPVRRALSGDAAFEKKQAAVARLIDAYRTYGHLAAQINPISGEKERPIQLNIEFYPELNQDDYDRAFQAESLMETPKSTLREIVGRLKEIYCGTMAAEYMYIPDLEEQRWIQHRVEHRRPILTAAEKIELLQQLSAAEGLEKYLAVKYVGQKRFSLEGGESFIPFMHAVNEEASRKGVKEVLVGMAHRGRLNMLINVFGKPAEELFQEFEGRRDYGLTSGDVKYHAGYASDINTKTGLLHLTLAFNPSHLEIVSPVVMGSVRARQDRRAKQQTSEVMSVLVHGDASFIGQGVVMETLSMSQTNAYGIKGSVHIIINNQVGFTTSNPADARSSEYCSDPAKMINGPVFHVNGDDPEAVIFAAKLAADYRERFQKDVFVDLICYRRLGHNEADEPIATQPLMYTFIRKHATTREIYAQKLINEGVCTQEQADTIVADYRNTLDMVAPVVKTIPNGLAHQYASNWKPYFDQDWRADGKTAVSKDKLMALGKRLQLLPEGFEVQRQVNHILDARKEMAAGKQPLDWGFAETLAYASLLDEGYSIRMSGQDCRRGTFAHRHAVLHDQKNGQQYIPLNHVNGHQASFEIYDSLLSEAGAMGFEYGYASTNPKTLVLWEAQYGDFANGAQVIVDQFMSSAWQKWGTLSGLTLLLPHGYEGAGPEHTSARLERYLQLCAQDNIQVCVPSTPAQIFHLLRRQVIRPLRIPLIVMTPKSLLRNKLAVSTLDELSNGQFQVVIDDTRQSAKTKPKRVVLCSGKVYYDLLSHQMEIHKNDVALVRVEQLYPFPDQELKALLASYSAVKDIVWCQEEPENQGAWNIIRSQIEACLAKDQHLQLTSRAASAAPAAGYMKLHVQQQQKLVNDALNVK